MSHRTHLPDGPPPILDAVTINYNGGERVLKTVAALLRQPTPLRRVHVIDRGSS